MITYNIQPKFHGQSIRSFLMFYHLSKSNIYKLESQKNLTINGQFRRFEHLLSSGDEMTIDFTQIHDSKTEPYPGDVGIIYEDDDLIILNKPPHLLVHTDGQTIDTLTNRLKNHMDQLNYPNPVMPVHRIDFDTSGMVIFSKHLLAQSYLSHLFETQDIEKTYIALCQSAFKSKVGVIDKKIGADRHSNKQIISQTGKDAKTIYRVLATDQFQSRVEADIVGGRKHQIRVHFASINHPVIGDNLYGKKRAERLMLHFKRVRFIHPRTLDNIEIVCKESF